MDYLVRCFNNPLVQSSKEKTLKQILSYCLHDWCGQGTKLLGEQSTEKQNALLTPIQLKFWQCSSELQSQRILWKESFYVKDAGGIHRAYG